MAQGGRDNQNGSVDRTCSSWKLSSSVNFDPVRRSISIRLVRMQVDAGEVALAPLDLSPLRTRGSRCGWIAVDFYCKCSRNLLQSGDERGSGRG
jgi:hypothetical protein